MNPLSATGSRVRIGELSRRTGVSDHVLRAWERRYALLRPVRTEGGYRLYSGDDEQRVRRMLDLLEQGLSPAEAARVARDKEQGDGAADPGTSPDGQILSRLRANLSTAVERLDPGRGQRALDTLLSSVTVETALREVLMPFLHDLGERWQRGDASIAQEHFASQLLRGRIAALAAGGTGGVGARALLACPPGERHDIALLSFGLVLGRQGWAVTFLGADTPVESVAELLDREDFEAVVLAASDPERFSAVSDGLAQLASRCSRLYLAGAGATAEVAAGTGADLLGGDPVTAALGLAER